MQLTPMGVEQLEDVEHGNPPEELGAVRSTAGQRATEWEALSHTMTEGIVIVEEPGVVVDANPAGLALLGVDRLEDLPPGVHRLLQLVTLLDAQYQPVPPGQRPSKRALRGELVHDFACTLVNQRGQERAVIISAVPIRPVPGMPRRVLIIHRDVTELRRLERERDEFVQVVSHELRNPLSAARALVDMIDRRLRPGERSQVGQHLRLTRRELDHVGQMLRELDAALRGRGDWLALQLQEVDLLEVLTAALLPQVLAQGEDRFELISWPPSPVAVRADPQRLREVMVNLLSNAVKYSPDRGRISLTIMRAQGHVLCQVADEGIGIPPDHLERVFLPFYRAPNAAQIDAGGRGLGLYISRRIVRSHGGELWAENRPEGGTAMLLRLPLSG